MAEPKMKVGIISCSGEELPGGTVARLATRRVLEALRPQSTVTLCLPLFLAGEESERRFARAHPTITVDGCSKLCAKHGTEAYSGRVAASLVVPELVGDERLARCHRSQRHLDRDDEEAVWIVADRLAAEVDALLVAGPRADPEALAGPDAEAGICACGRPAPEGNLTINGAPVAVNGLPLIFEQLAKRGLEPGAASGETLLQTVRIYHPVDAQLEAAYRAALVDAYQAFCLRRSAGAVRA